MKWRARIQRNISCEEVIELAQSKKFLLLIKSSAIAFIQFSLSPKTSKEQMIQRIATVSSLHMFSMENMGV